MAGKIGHENEGASGLLMSADDAVSLLYFFELLAHWGSWGLQGAKPSCSKSLAGTSTEASARVRECPNHIRERVIEIFRCAVFEKSGQPAWASLPRLQIQKGGEKTLIPLLAVPRELKERIYSAILDDYRRLCKH